MNEWFHVGQKVVCVDAHNTHAEGVCELLEGAIYTIRRLGTWGLPYETPSLSVWLSEVTDRVDPEYPEIGEVPFNARRFRPLRKRTTSIEVFKQLLVTPPKEFERV